MMIKKKSAILMAIIFTALSLTTLLHGVPLASSTPSESMAKPIFQVKIEKPVISSGETFMVFLYVKNPSTNLETEASLPPYPIHRIEVTNLNVKFVNPAGATTYEATFVPGVDFIPRWDTKVYPFETSLVFWVGWGGSLGDPGVYTLTFTLTVTFKGQTLDLVDTLKLTQTA